MMSSYRQFNIPCSCGSIHHTIQLTVYHEGKQHYPHDKDISVCFIVNPKSLLEKIKAIWYVISGKDYINNDALLFREQVDVLKEAIKYYDSEDSEIPKRSEETELSE